VTLDASGGRGSQWLELTKGECFELLAGQRLGRLAFVDALGPIVLPVNFVLDTHMVVIRTMNIYSHVIPAMQQEAAGQMDVMLGEPPDEATVAEPDRGEQKGEKG
jgi:hypothetical protein